MKNIPIKAAWVSLVVSSVVAILLGFGLDSGNAAESGSEQESRTEELAKETQNPVANLISVPFQNNFNFGIGPNDATQLVLNVQPVIPVTLNKDWRDDNEIEIALRNGCHFAANRCADFDKPRRALNDVVRQNAKQITPSTQTS